MGCVSMSECQCGPGEKASPSGDPRLVSFAIDIPGSWVLGPSLVVLDTMNDDSDEELVSISQSIAHKADPLYLLTR